MINPMSVQTTKVFATNPRRDDAGTFRWRMLKDVVARHLVGIGGISVIIFITLIFVYLAYVVIPLFQSAEVHIARDFPLSNTHDPVVHLALEEQTEIATVMRRSGHVEFLDTRTGVVRSEQTLVKPTQRVYSFGAGDLATGVAGYGFDDGTAIIFSPRFTSEYRENGRTIVPSIKFPAAQEPVVVDPNKRPLITIAVQANESHTTVVAATDDNRVLLVHGERVESFLEETDETKFTLYGLPTLAHPIDFLMIDKSQENVFAVSRQGWLTQINVRTKANVHVVESLQLTGPGVEVTALRFLAGDVSLLVGDSTGHIAQWSSVRQADDAIRIMKLREFNPGPTAISAIAPDLNRKGFLAADRDGKIGIFYSTARRTLAWEPFASGRVDHLAVAPRSNAALFLSSDGRLNFMTIDNPHPEVSLASLWQKVWYENYSEPAYIWQSSAANDDFEPKFSLVPLAVGTLKGAFYAMLVAIPLALLGAIYTAQFMAPRMRTFVKPGIEIMAALPTVILGFLAGLWLAPYVEAHLPGVIIAAIAVPCALLVCAWSWSRLPLRIRQVIPDGWEAAVLLPVIIATAWAAMSISPAVEYAFFGGEIRIWLSQELGIGYDQRNAIVVGIAMGFAVIPTIFSIAEDAVFGVPKNLIHGSLALGATPWQTVTRVVILTASPGIFSAIMIGFGRAVGETMIVLMATGNTPVMNFNPFEGLRTLSANIAVELPESEVNSTHFRILFLAGLVLFMFTFAVNTVAEIVRQRLRRKYGSL